jgi:hypothetical protein
MRSTWPIWVFNPNDGREQSRPFSFAQPKAPRTGLFGLAIPPTVAYGVTMIDTLALAVQYILLDYGPQFATCAAVGTIVSLVFLGAHRD